jgi:hypothetical protein
MLRKIEPSCTAPTKIGIRAAVAGGEQRGLLHAEGFFDLGDGLAEQVVQLRRGHALLKLRLLQDGAEQHVGLEERLLPEAEVVDADDAREAQREVARVGVDLADAVADDAVGVVVEVGAGGGDAVDEPALDERDEARLVEPRRGHGAGEGQEGGVVLVHGAGHELVAGALLAAHEGRKAPAEQLVRGLAAGDAADGDLAGVLEVASQCLAVRRHRLLALDRRRLALVLLLLAHWMLSPV